MFIEYNSFCVINGDIFKNISDVKNSEGKTANYRLGFFYILLLSLPGTLYYSMVMNFIVKSNHISGHNILIIGKGKLKEG